MKHQEKEELCLRENDPGPIYQHSKANLKIFFLLSSKYYRWIFSVPLSEFIRKQVFTTFVSNKWCFTTLIRSQTRTFKSCLYQSRRGQGEGWIRLPRSEDPWWIRASSEAVDKVYFPPKEQRELGRVSLWSSKSTLPWTFRPFTEGLSRWRIQG